MSEKFAIIDYMGMWNIGAYIFATNKFTLIGEGFRPQVLTKIKEILNTEVYTIKVLGEDLIGCFLVANSYGILLPRETTDSEINTIKNFLGDDIIIERINIRRVKNALGNIIATNDKIAIISKSLYQSNSHVNAVIEDVLNVELIPFDIKFTDAIASYLLLNNKGLVASPLLSDEEIDKLRAIFGFPHDRVIVSTINMGNPIIRSGSVANDFGILVGNKTSGIELTRIYNALIK